MTKTPGRSGPRMARKAPVKSSHGAYTRPHVSEDTMADCIERFWRARGYPEIKAWVEDNGVIASNLRADGRPPKE